jgi:YHS domain-containing protein
MEVDERTAPSYEYEGKTYYFMNDLHMEAFKKKPKKYLQEAHLREDYSH